MCPIITGGTQGHIGVLSLLENNMILSSIVLTKWNYQTLLIVLTFTKQNMYYSC